MGAKGEEGREEGDETRERKKKERGRGGEEGEEGKRGKFIDSVDDQEWKGKGRGRARNLIQNQQKNDGSRLREKTEILVAIPRPPCQ